MDNIKYKSAVINQIFTFAWDISETCFSDLCESVKDSEDWEVMGLFERPIKWNGNQKANYHPNIVSQNLNVIQSSGLIDANAIIKPLRLDDFTCGLYYTIRVHENGTGNCTLSFNLKESVDIKKIHSILRLSSSIYYKGEGNNSEHDRIHENYSSIVLSENSVLKSNKNLSLVSLFEKITDKITPEEWNKDVLSFDKKVISSKTKNYENWQTPYPVSLVELEEESYKKFEDKQSPESIKELGSIACKLTGENLKIEDDISKLKREYLFNSFGYYNCICDNKSCGETDYNRTGARLKNYSHHSDLFYTIGKRGALAVTPSFYNNPSYYAIPTLLNLTEILRSRWHLGSIVNLKLDDLMEVISHEKNLKKLQDEVFNCRVLFGLFLKNPAPYLFDGGAITEIAEIGESIFWLNKLSVEMDKKFKIIDNLLDDIYSRQRFNELI